MTRPPTSTLILASASASRAAMLRAAGLIIETDPADIDEATLKTRMLNDGEDAGVIAQQLATEKALSVTTRHPGKLVLGADQVLAFREKLFSKASDLAEARRQLQELRGQQHKLTSAACLACDGQPVWQGAASTALTMRTFTDAYLDDYLAKAGDAILGSVGCYQFEGLGAQLFERIDGDYFTVLGLPLLQVLGALRKRGVLQA
ncbi:MAG: Maf family protein [Pseudomonadota bacterium]